MSAHSDSGGGPFTAAAGPASGRWRRLRRRRLPSLSTRTRILAAFAILIAVSAALSLFLVREILFNRLDEQLGQQLTQEVAEFRRLVRGNDPRTGEPFGTNVRRIFDVYFSRNIYADETALRAEVERRLGVEVIAVTLSQIDYVRDVTQLEAQYVPRLNSVPAEPPGFEPEREDALA